MISYEHLFYFLNAFTEFQNGRKWQNIQVRTYLNKNPKCIIFPCNLSDADFEAIHPCIFI